MRVDVAGDLLLVHMWHGREHRLLAANTGMGVDAAPGTLRVPHRLVGREWAVVASTDDRGFGGTGGQVRFDHRLISMPPHTVAWLSARDRALPMRALRAAFRLITRRT